MPLFLKASEFIALIRAILKDYGGIVSSIMVQYLVPVELSVRLPASYSVVPFLITAQEIHCSTYTVNHVVSHNAVKSHQVNGVLHPQEALSLCKKNLGEKEQVF